MDKEKLLALDIEEAEVPLLRGGSVIVQGITRTQHLVCRMTSRDSDNPVEEAEVQMLVFGMKEPALTRDEVLAWRANGRAGDFDKVIEVIGRLSGLDDGANKETYKSFRERSGTGVRVFPSTATVHDGGGPAPEDDSD